MALHPCSRLHPFSPIHPPPPALLLLLSYITRYLIQPKRARSAERTTGAFWDAVRVQAAALAITWLVSFFGSVGTIKFIRCVSSSASAVRSPCRGLVVGKKGYAES